MSTFEERWKKRKGENAIAEAFIKGKSLDELFKKHGVSVVEAALRACLMCDDDSHYGKPVLTQRECSDCEDEAHMYDCAED